MNPGFIVLTQINTKYTLWTPSLRGLLYLVARSLIQLEQGLASGPGLHYTLTTLSKH